MSSFSLHIATDGAAFEGGNLSDEIARVLRQVAYKLDHGHAELDRADHRYGANCGTVADDNGNTCGRWLWTDRSARVDDGAALDRLAEQLTGREWHAGDIEGAAEWIAATGREIAEPRGEDDE